jgi:hypothetical protein
MHPTTSTAVRGFADADLLTYLWAVSNAELDDVDFGVIGLDSRGIVRRYNRFESEFSGLARQRVFGPASVCCRRAMHE